MSSKKVNKGKKRGKKDGMEKRIHRRHNLLDDLLDEWNKMRRLLSSFDDTLCTLWHLCNGQKLKNHKVTQALHLKIYTKKRLQAKS
jgi:hypothetical protein